MSTHFLPSLNLQIQIMVTKYLRKTNIFNTWLCYRAQGNIYSLHGDVYIQIQFLYCPRLSYNKKHSENADNSTSVTFDLYLRPWPYFKVKKAYVILCRLLYCVLVPGMMSVNVIVFEIWPLIHFCDLWPSPVTYSLCQGHFLSNL